LRRLGQLVAEELAVVLGRRRSTGGSLCARWSPLGARASLPGLRRVARVRRFACLDEQLQDSKGFAMWPAAQARRAPRRRPRRCR
jgi:hypothetical protein